MAIDYSVFTPIDEQTAIASFFNHIMKKVGILRELCAPSSFRKDARTSEFTDGKFCDFCRYEAWMHAVCERLSQWQYTIGEYFSEYHGNWRYYAACQRLSYISEYGAEESELNADGSVKTEGLRDADYLHYTIISDIYDDGFEDIVQDTVPNDMTGLCSDVLATARMDFTEYLQRNMSCSIEVAQMTEDGEVKPLSRDERELFKASEMVSAEDDTRRLVAVIGGVHGIMHMITACPQFEDNAERLQMVSDAVSALQDMDFRRLGSIVIDYDLKYVVRR